MDFSRWATPSLASQAFFRPVRLLSRIYGINVTQTIKTTFYSFNSEHFYSFNRISRHLFLLFSEINVFGCFYDFFLCAKPLIFKKKKFLCAIPKLFGFQTLRSDRKSKKYKETKKNF